MELIKDIFGASTGQIGIKKWTLLGYIVMYLNGQNWALNLIKMA